MSIKGHQWWKRHCTIKWTEWFDQLMSVILCHWWSQCWYNELMNVVVLVAEMEAIHGPKSMGFHFPLQITTVANKYQTLEINIKWDLICHHQSLKTLTSYLAAGWIHCSLSFWKGQWLNQNWYMLWIWICLSCLQELSWQHHPRVYTILHNIAQTKGLTLK